MLNLEKLFSEAEKKDEVENFAHFEKNEFFEKRQPSSFSCFSYFSTGKNKGEKADSVYPGYGGDPKGAEDPEDTMGIQRIQWGSRGYNGNPEDTMGIQRIPVGRL